MLGGKIEFGMQITGSIAYFSNIGAEILKIKAFLSVFKVVTVVETVEYSVLSEGFFKLITLHTVHVSSVSD